MTLAFQRSATGPRNYHHLNIGMVEIAESGDDMGDEGSTEQPSARDTFQSIHHRAARRIEERQHKLAELEAEVVRLKAENKQLGQIVGTAESVVVSLDSALYAQASRRLDAAKQFADTVALFDPSQGDAVQRGAAEIREQARDAVRALAESIPSLLTAELAPDAGSRFPRFSFRDGFLTIDINAKRLEAVAQTRGCKQVRIDADAAVIVEYVAQEINRCFHRSVDLQAFGRQLRAAFEHVRAATGQEAVSLQSVLEAFAETPPPRDEFAVDLAALIRLPVGSEPPEIRGMKLDHTRDTDTGFLLPGHETTGYIGSISFHDHEGAR
jgi:hypothetical protein